MSAEPVPWRLVLDRIADSVAVYELDGRVRYVNAATERIFGKPLAELEGRVLWAVFPDAVGNPFHACFERVAAGGEPETFDHYYPPFDRWFSNRMERVGEQVHVLARDVTDDVRRRRRLEALARTAELLAADDLHLASTLQAVADVLSDVLRADACLALLTGDRAWLEMAAVAAIEPSTLPFLQTVTRWTADAGLPGIALRTRSAVLADPAEVTADHRSRDPAVRDVVARYQPGSALVAPLLVGDEAIGVLIVSRRHGAHALTSDDRTLMAEIAPSVALYVAHARRRAEAASLRARATAVADASPACVSFVDRDQRYQYVNAAYERLFGRPRSELLGQHLEEVLGAVAYRGVLPGVTEALAGQPVHFRSVIPFAHGECHMDVHYQPFIDGTGAVDGFAVTAVDVTDEVRIAAQQRDLLEAERRVTHRLESLLGVTSRLAAADTPDEIARVVVDDGVAAVEADLAGLWLVSADGRELVLQREHGSRPEHVAAFAKIPVGGPGPVPDCFGTGRSIWIDSGAEYVARYPGFESAYRAESAPPLSVAILPLATQGRVVGCLSFTFLDERRLTADARTYLEVLSSHAAEALRRSTLYTEVRDASETWAAVIQASPAAVMLLDADGIVHAWNPAAERIFGWTAAEAIGRFQPAVGEERRAELLANLVHLLDGHVIEGLPTRRVRKDGVWLEVEIYAAPVRLSHDRTLCLSTVVDVSERARVERGRRLVAAAAAVMTRSLECDDNLAEVVRLAVPTFADGCTIEVHGDPPRHHAAGLDPADPAVRSRLSVPLAVGDRGLGTLAVASRTGGLDEVDRMIAVELAAHVAAAVENARLYQDARTARTDAEAASRAKDQFLAMLGHELRNPLAPITTALHLMRLRAPGQVERERDVIERQVKHLTRLVDDLLDVSRITRGKVELRRERTPVAAVVAKAIEITSPLFEQRGHRLTVDVPAELVVHGDPVRLAQVVANLLSNAAKYTEGAGHVDVRAARQDDEVVLAVKDDGIGLAPEMLSSIFDMFVQAPQPSARTDGGLGLGLAIVRALVEVHGGRVSARSAGLGHGTELSVTLPLASERSDDAPAPAETVRAAVATARRVLVVDDNEDAAALMSEVLDTHGYQTRTAFDGPSALVIAETFQPEIAVLDIGLPVMDGYELAQKLRAVPALVALRLIAVSGYGQESDRARSRAAGFDAHVAKPISIATLMELIERAPGLTS